MVVVSGVGDAEGDEVGDEDGLEVGVAGDVVGVLELEAVQNRLEPSVVADTSRLLPLSGAGLLFVQNFALDTLVSTLSAFLLLLCFDVTRYTDVPTIPTTTRSIAVRTLFEKYRVSFP